MEFFKNYFKNHFKQFKTDDDKRKFIQSTGLKFPYEYSEIEKVKVNTTDKERDVLHNFEKTGWPMLEFNNRDLMHFKNGKFIKTNFDNNHLDYSQNNCYELLRTSESIANSMVVKRWIDSREGPGEGDAWM